MKLKKLLGALLALAAGMTALFGEIEIRVIPITSRNETLPFVYRFARADRGRISLKAVPSPRGNMIGRKSSIAGRLKDHPVTIQDMLAEGGAAKPGESLEIHGDGEFVLSADEIDRAYLVMSISVEGKRWGYEFYCVPVALLSRTATTWTDQPNQSVDRMPGSNAPGESGRP